MKKLEIRSLGRLELTLDGKELNLRATKARALVCFLAVSRRTYSREELAGMFWSDLPEDDARNNLRVTLAQLRQLIPEHLRVTRKTIAFDFGALYTLDVEAFTSALHKAESDALFLLREALELYQGDFFESFSVQGAPLFEEWVAAQRERLRQLALQALRTLTDASIKQGDDATAGDYLTRLLVLDPWREEAHRQLMLVYARQGEQAAALAQYQMCCRILAEELGLEPSPETNHLYEQIRKAETGLSPSATLTRGAPPVAERRHVTILAAELIVELSTDPEDLGDQIAAFRRACATAFRHFDGFIPNNQSATQVTYFGIPQAHEDDPRRAVLAALMLVTEVSRLLPPQRVRVAIHSGAVVVTTRGETVDIVGLPLLIAQRLCGASRPDAVLVSCSTERLLHGYFVLSTEERFALEGMAEPVVAFQVLRESGVRGRLDAAPPRAPMVGRQVELTTLKQLYGEVLSGTGKAVLVLGEAGIGKSRLIFDFKNGLSDEVGIIEAQGVSYHTSTPYYPLTAWLSRELDLHNLETVDARLERLQDYLGSLDLLAGEVLPALTRLLSMPVEDGAEVSPERWRLDTQRALLRLFLAKASRHPLVVVVEDLHWYDASTLEVLRLLTIELRSSRTMLLMTSRTELDEGVAPDQHLERLRLENLSNKQTRELFSALAEGNELSLTTENQLTAMSDGVPLYAEELFQSLLDSRGDATDGVPLTLQDALTARLDQSGEAKKVAQFAAVLGATFALDLLIDTSPYSESMVRDSLHRLIAIGLILFDKPQNLYIFKHSLMQEAAYNTLLRKQRQGFHGDIARTLAKRHASSIRVAPERLAYHFSGAALYSEAVQAWQEACARALGRFAYTEAIQHLRAALEALEHLPEASTRDETELTLTLNLAEALHVTQGYASAAAKEAFDRAYQLCASTHQTHHLFPILLGQAGYHGMRAEFTIAEDLLQQLATLPSTRLAPQQLDELHFLTARVNAYQGNLKVAEQYFTSVLPARGDDLLVLNSSPWSTEFQYAALGQFSAVQWLLGFPDQSLDSALRAIAQFENNSNLHLLASAISMGMFVYFVRGERVKADKMVSAFMLIVAKKITTSWLASGKVWQGTLAIANGQTDGVTLIRDGLRGFDAQGTVTQRPFLLWHYALALKTIGHFDQSAVVIEEALAQCNKTGERWWEPEIFRLKGSLLLQAGNPAEAVTCFYESVELARAQHARSLELRAWCSLAEASRALHEDFGAKEGLASSLSWFGEGFFTRDLNRGRALLYQNI